MRLFQAFDIDEETPVQFLGVYTTKWRPEWGKPQIMFREVDDPVYKAAPDLLAACELAFEFLGDWLPADWSYYPKTTREIPQKLKAAITKAKGGSDDDVGNAITSGTE